MSKKLLLISILSIFHSFCLDSTHKTDAQKIVSIMFGSTIEKADKEQIIDLVDTLLHADKKIVIQAAQLAEQKLQKELTELKARIEQKKVEGKIVDPKLFYEQFVFEHTIEYLRVYYTQHAESVSFFGQLYSWLNSIVGSHDPQAIHIADAIVQFNRYLVENYLLDYHKLLLFFAGMKKTSLPDVINFWTNQEQQLKLQKRAATLKTSAKTQWVEEIVMVALQSLLLGGEGMYKQWLDEQAQAEFLELQKKITKRSTEFDTFLKGLADKQKNEIVPAILNSFKAGQKAISDQYDIINKNQQIELNYLFQSINLDMPAQHCLMFPAIPWDQYFENSIMLTPENGHPWYNVFQVNYGNLGWIFDTTTNSFMQTGLAFFGTPFWSNTDNAGSDPSQNAIFTEYISSQPSYDIEIDVNVINCSYPFFAGVMFNRARWISADPERIWQYRLIGLYGTQTDPKDPKTRAIDLRFAQQIIQFDTDKTTGQQKETILSPLQQITSQKTPLFTLPETDIDTLDKESITYSFKITTAPTQVKVTLLKKDSSGNAKQLYSTTLTNLDGYLSIFHGIGFISPGCQAAFKIIKPEALVYTKEQLATLTKKTSQLLTKLPRNKKKK